MLAHLGRVLHDPIGFGDLAQRVAAMAWAAPLARACAKALQDPRLLLQTVARWRLGAVGAVQIQTSPKLGVLGPKRFDLAFQRIDQLTTAGGRTIPLFIRKFDPVSRKKRTAPIDPLFSVAFRTHPAWRLRQSEMAPREVPGKAQNGIENGGGGASASAERRAGPTSRRGGRPWQIWQRGPSGEVEADLAESDLELHLADRIGESNASSSLARSRWNVSRCAVRPPTPGSLESSVMSRWIGGGCT